MFAYFELTAILSNLKRKLRENIQKFACKIKDLNLYLKVRKYSFLQILNIKFYVLQLLLV